MYIEEIADSFIMNVVKRSPLGWNLQHKIKYKIFTFLAQNIMSMITQLFSTKRRQLGRYLLHDSVPIIFAEFV